MRKLSAVLISSLLLISCQEASKSVGKSETEKVVTDSGDSISQDNNTLKDNQSVSLPFDFEKYTAVCLQQSSPDCKKIYPRLNDADFEKVSQILGGKSEDIPTNIFQIDSKLNNSNIKIYLLDFEGDSTFQEVITVSKDKIIARKSVGHSMPEEKTYKSFVIANDMTINVYEIEFENLKKKLTEKYTILSSGEISGK